MTNHSILLEERNKLKITAVVEVEQFDEEKIILLTEEEILIIEGQNLHIQKLSIEEGELLIDGNVDAISYSDKSRGKAGSGGFFARLLK